MNILRIHKEGGVQVELRCSFGGVVDNVQNRGDSLKNFPRSNLYVIILHGFICALYCLRFRLYVTLIIVKNKKSRTNSHKKSSYELSVLRLCVWLFDNGYMELFYMDQGFLPTFRTE